MDEKALIAKIEALEKEVARLSKHTDAVEVQNLMSRYIFYMENGKIAEVWDDLWSHTNPDVRVEIMDSGAYLGQEHVKRVWYTMGRRMDKHGNMIDTTPKVGEMSNTNTDRAFLLLMLTISSPMIEISEDGNHAWGQWHIFGPHTNRVFDPETKMKKDTAFWIAGKYDNEFVKENGEWKILKLRPICGPPTTRTSWSAPTAAGRLHPTIRRMSRPASPPSIPTRAAIPTSGGPFRMNISSTSKERF